MKSSEVVCETIEPVLLNCWKHHSGFIKSKIAQYKKNPESNIRELVNEMLSIGESLMDLYIGELTPQEIANAVANHLTNESISGPVEYKNWLNLEDKDFKIIKLADRSQWTLRLGEKKTKYVHIHPSRYSPHTVRVRSTTLKSAILFSTFDEYRAKDQLVLINRIRKELS